MTERLRLLLMIVAACTAHTLTAREFTVVAYNVENLLMWMGLRFMRLCAERDFKR